MKLSSLLMGAALATLCACGHGAAPALASPGRVSAPLRYEDRLHARIVRGYRARGWNPDRAVVIGVFDGTRSTVTSFGRLAPTADTLFEIGSVTKLLTGALLAREVQQGKVRLDEPVQDLLPELRLPSFAGQQVELVHLATYSAGYPWMPTNWVQWRDGATYSPAQWKTFLESFELPRAPGTRFEYGNVGFGLLGDALGAAEKTTFSAALRREILLPLGMTRSRLLGESLAGESVAPGFDDDGEPVALDHDKPYQAGCCALWSSANDMLAFVAAHFAGASAASPDLTRSLEAALEPRIRGDDDYAALHVGLGWFLYDNGVATKNGVMAGYRSGIVLDHARRLGVVVLAADSGLDAEALAGDLLRAVAFERERPAAPVVERLPVDAQTRAVAEVRWEPGMVLVGWSAPAAARPGETVTVKAYYRSQAATEQSLRIRVEAEEEGAETLHADHRPLWPTTDWSLLPGLVVDSFTLTIPPGQPRGALTVWTGFAGTERAAVVGAAGTSRRVKGPTIEVR